MPRPRSQEAKSRITPVRLSESERLEMEKASVDEGFNSLSSYIRHLHHTRRKESRGGRANLNLSEINAPDLFARTDYGKLLHGDSTALLHRDLAPASVDLVVTSPPFGLVRKKDYGNEDADLYLEWFRPFAEGFRRVLKETGSLVIDIGGAWKPGLATRSLYHFELLVMLCREYGFHLCQEHYWWNPSKLPTPAEWVNVRRVRVKDAVNCVWWLSPTPWPKASNRRILAPYSDSMNDLLRNGYTARLRPSGHDISENFSIDNGGSVPPNLLALANTESSGRYQDYCRANDLDIHPARFPAGLPEYFVRMLTDTGDLVVDPFGGSCVTGEVCEALKRNWVCCELDQEYLRGALGRFQGIKPIIRRKNATPYQIQPPCSLPIDDKTTPLALDGGRKRPVKPAVQGSFRLDYRAA